MILLICLLNSCDEENLLIDDNASLVFSTDTVMFDTVFTSIGSTTQNFRVINKYGQPIEVSSIYLAGGDHSNFKLTIDGVSTSDTADVYIQSMDSVFVFVEVNVDPNGGNQPMIVEDSIVFTINGNQQVVNLMAWGQDFVPIRNLVIDKDTTWNSEKPYLVYNKVEVKAGATLKIDAGTKVYFHKDAQFVARGNVKAVGTTNEPIIFTGDRLEKLYEDVPSQWYGVILLPNSKTNVFENVRIYNAIIGLQVGHFDYDGVTNVKLENVKIEHMAFAGIYALTGNINASNTVVADCGYFCVSLNRGGDYDFNHCTIANYWGLANRQTHSFFFSNFYQLSDTTVYYGDLNTMNLSNSVIWGSLSSEFGFFNHEDYAANFNLDHCLVKIADSVDVTNSKHYKAIIKNEDPYFVNYSQYDWQLDTLSVAKDAGSIDFGELVPNDLLNVSRLEDDGPDLGAYERVEKKAGEKE